MKKKLLFALCACTLLGGVLTGCGSNHSKDTLTVLNFGKYIDPDVLAAFEEETGIHVDYEEYITPENMYTKYRASAIDYDLICTSDYMIERLINEGEVLELNYDNIPLSKNLDSTYFEFSKSFDPENKYSIPYFFGTVGILYNKEMVDTSKVDSWNILWDKEYKEQIIMPDSVRDSFMVALKLLGFSLNTTDEAQLLTASKLLKKQKPLVYSYLVDEAQYEMIAENAAMAVVYSGEAAVATGYNENLAFSIPKEGSNMWIDSWFIPKSCKHQENAEQFLNFLCREDIAMKNFNYVYYATPNSAVFNALDDVLQTNTTIFPPKEILDNCEILKPLDDKATVKFNELWKELKSFD
ncbi:MAG: ABC transporter substrate-binding protein [Lachnospiraceae bacterium]